MRICLSTQRKTRAIMPIQPISRWRSVRTQNIHVTALKLPAYSLQCHVKSGPWYEKERGNSSSKNGCPLCSVICKIKVSWNCLLFTFHAPSMSSVTVTWWFAQIHSITIRESIGTAVTPLITAYVSGDCFCRVLVLHVSRAVAYTIAVSKALWFLFYTQGMFRSLCILHFLFLEEIF